jgi:dTDP-4-dehydrorhamnose reductase
MGDAQTILVIGKSGQLARCLAEQDSQGLVRAVGRDNVDLADVHSIEGVLDEIKPGTLINAAAYTAVDRAESEQDSCYALNCTAAERLAMSARRRRLPFIHVSTDYVFDGEKTSAYFEEDARAPLGVYGRSKMDGEDAVMRAHPEAIVVRTSWVFSRFGTNFLKTMRRLADNQPVVRVVSDQSGCPTSAHDLADALLRLVDNLHKRKSAPTGVYHLAGHGKANWFEFASEIFRFGSRVGWPVPKLEAITTAEYPTVARRPINSILDCSKINDEHGIEMPHWSASLKSCVERI